jgi:ComF family protein
MRPMSLEATPSIQQFSRGLAAIGRRALDFILPPVCLRCRTLVSDPQSLCGSCWSELKFLAEPLCACCGLPFPHALGEGVKCVACMQSPPVFDKARAALAYDDISRDLILPLKHADRLEAASLFGRWMANVAKDLISDADTLMPVPLHWRRLAKRRYNQAAVLAHAIAKHTNLSVDAASLQRPKPSVSQGEMPSARARLKNVARAFTVSNAQKHGVQGRRILLVDDVLTTGATLNACAKALKRAGAGSVSVVTLARVVRPLSPSL